MINQEEIYLTPKQIVIKNAIWLYASNFINKILRIILVIISARFLGPYFYGNFSYAFSIANFFLMFSDWGLSSLLIRNFQISEDRKRIVQEIISLKVILVLIITIFALIGYIFIKDSPAKVVYLIILSALTLDVLRDTINTFFKATQKMEISSLSLVIETFLVTGLGIFFLYLKRDIFYLGTAYFLGAFISYIYSLAKIFQLFKTLNFSFSFFNALEYLKQGTPLLLLGLLGFIFFNFDHIIIGYLRGMEELGYFSPISKIMLNLNLIPEIAMTALFPYLAKISLEKNKLKKIYRRIFIIFMALSLALVMTLFFSVNLWFFKIFGIQYKTSSLIFKILIWTTIFLFGLNLLDKLLFILDKQWLNFYATSFCAILNIILDLWLVTIYGALGAATATLLTQAINFLISLFLVEYSLKS